MKAATPVTRGLPAAWLALCRMPGVASSPLMARGELPLGDPPVADDLPWHGILPRSKPLAWTRRPGKAGMTPNFHPSEETLLAYAAGTLQQPQAVVVASHAALCPVCRAAIASGAAVGGALLDSL